jgi:hypothetical protein
LNLLQLLLLPQTELVQSRLLKHEYVISCDRINASGMLEIADPWKLLRSRVRKAPCYNRRIEADAKVILNASIDIDNLRSQSIYIQCVHASS